MYEQRIIDPILKKIKEHQEYLTQPENLPQLAKLGYIFNTLWYGGRTASYNGVIEKIFDPDTKLHYEQCDDNPKYKIEMCDPIYEEIENYIYDAWGMHVSNDYVDGWEDFRDTVKGLKVITELEKMELKLNKTFDDWVEILTHEDYKYNSLFPNRKSVANHLLCTIGTEYVFKDGYVYFGAGGADQNIAEYGDWKNAKFLEDIQVLVDSILEDEEVIKVLKHVQVLKEEKQAEELSKEIRAFGMPYNEYSKKKDKEREERNLPFSYYPICNYSIIEKLDKKSHPSYIKAAIEICEDILSNCKVESQIESAKHLLSKLKPELKCRTIKVYKWRDIEKAICEEMEINPEHFCNYHLAIGGDYKNLWHEYLENYGEDVVNDTIVIKDCKITEYIIEDITRKNKQWLMPFVEAIDADFYKE